MPAHAHRARPYGLPMSIELDLTGRTAIVTGGAKGIGLGIARAFREAGAQVSVWGRDQETAGRVAAEIGAHAAGCDVRDRARVEAALADTVAALGNVHIVVTAAGRGAGLRPFLELPEAEWQDVLETNLTGVFRTCQVVGCHMAEHGEGGKMVLLSSVRAAMGAPVASDYAATKGGLESMLRCMAMSLAPHDIQVNAVRPGWIRTEMTKRMWSNPEQGSAPTAAVPAGRWGEPADLAGLVTYLVSPLASFHTGDVITVDGGLTAAAGGETRLGEP